MGEGRDGVTGGKAGVNVKDNSDRWQVPGAHEERRGHWI